MAPSLLDIPSELRSRVLEYAVTLEPIVICAESRDHYAITTNLFETPQEGLTSNPRLSLYLICSQINSELSAITFPLLELKMCSYRCIDEYFRTQSLLQNRISSVEVPFVYEYPGSPTMELRMKKDLLAAAGPWASSVDLIVMTTFRGLLKPRMLYAKGKAIFKH